MGESHQVPPWLYDDSSKVKRFTLAGSWPEEARAEVIFRMKSLGGELVETDEWDDRVTHVIAHFQPFKYDGLPEKVMGAIAAGRFVVTKVRSRKSVSVLSHVVFLSRGLWTKASAMEASWRGCRRTWPRLKPSSRAGGDTTRARLARGGCSRG